MKAIHQCEATMRCTDCGHQVNLAGSIADLSRFLGSVRAVSDTCTKVTRTCPYAQAQTAVVFGPPAPEPSLMQKVKQRIGLS